MAKLRHISGGNLKELEAVIESIKTPIIIKGVNSVGANWYIHFLVQDEFKDNIEFKMEQGLATMEVPRPIKKGRK